MNEQNIITKAQNNMLCWKGVQQSDPKLAQWMEKHINQLGVLNHSGNLTLIGKIEELLNGYVYQLPI